MSNIPIQKKIKMLEEEIIKEESEIEKKKEKINVLYTELSKLRNEEKKKFSDSYIALLNKTEVK